MNVCLYHRWLLCLLAWGLALGAPTAAHWAIVDMADSPAKTLGLADCPLVDSLNSAGEAIPPCAVVAVLPKAQSLFRSIRSSDDWCLDGAVSAKSIHAGPWPSSGRLGFTKPEMLPRFDVLHPMRLQV